MMPEMVQSDTVSRVPRPAEAAQRALAPGVVASIVAGGPGVHWQGAGGVGTALKGLPTQVASHLRHLILTGQLAPGTRLQQSDLAHGFGVSITPVREAIRLLAAQGLVDLDTFVGGVVHRPTAVDLADRYLVQLALCPLAVRSAIRNITDVDLARARSLLIAMNQAADREAWLQVNREFHRILDDAIAERHLARLMHELADMSDFYIFVSLPYRERRPVRRHAHSEHEELIEAFEARDEKRAVRATKVHLTNTYRACLKALNDSNSLPSALPDSATLQPPGTMQST
jgi:DNA-binding GntR family transcriptional regulator